ncbi:unnamed protein product [Linum tenue]|uniref:RING-type domain-containing protein n=1 Tax=Linum tenue TaxID=586396 RepID=A0AAV0IP31_9ROSI|nr:unnamed protein product [Linum tenue]
MASNNFLLNVVATVTTTLSTGDLVSDMKHRIFPLPLHPLLNKETALPHVRNVSDAISIPLHPSVLEKVVDSARHVKSVVVEEQGKMCAICLERFEVSGEAIRLRCGHLYHRDCIGNWLQKGKRQCPVCRSQIP